MNCVECGSDTWRVHAKAQVRVCDRCNIIQPQQHVDRDGLWERMPTGVWVLIEASLEFQAMMRRRYFGHYVQWVTGG